MTQTHRLTHNAVRYHTPFVEGAFNIPQDAFGNVRVPGFSADLNWLGKFHQHFVLHGIILNDSVTAERVLAVQALKINSSGNITNSTTVLNPSVGNGVSYGWHYLGDVTLFPAPTASLGADEQRANGFAIISANANATGFLVWSLGGF